MNNYPEHDKLKAIKNESVIVQGFIDWLLDEANYIICEFDSVYDDYYNALSSRTREQLMAEYFDIDLVALSEEKDRMLDEWRESQGLQ